MPNIDDQFEESIFGYDELRDLTGWPDILLEDYFAQKRNVLLVAQVEDQVILDVQLLKGDTATQAAQINRLNAILKSAKKLINKQEHLLTMAMAQNASLRVKVTRQATDLSNIKQLSATVWP